MSSGSVNPLTTSVSTIVVEARKMIRSRPGNGAPVAVTSGIDRAAAMVTEPRNPAQPTIKTCRGSRKPSRSRILPNRKRPQVRGRKDPTQGARTLSATHSTTA